MIMDNPDDNNDRKQKEKNKETNKQILSYKNKDYCTVPYLMNAISAENGTHYRLDVDGGGRTIIFLLTISEYVFG